MSARRTVAVVLLALATVLPVGHAGDLARTEPVVLAGPGHCC